MDVEITPFRDEFAPAFERLNRDWLERFGLLEESDLHYLRDPRGEILEPGGAIFVALFEGTVVGTVAALRLPERTYELAKLVVTEAARGQGLGRRLTQAVLDHAAREGAQRVVLSSNHQLREAVHLYESMGFRHVESLAAGVEYASADVFMELQLT